MIERLNFFDLYAYLIPGLAWIGLVSAPFLIVGGVHLPEAWVSALIGVAAAYVAGHVLYQSMRKVPAFDVRDDEGRMPSKKLLDPNSRLPVEIKDRVRVRALQLWNIDLPIPNIRQIDGGIRRKQAGRVRSGGYLSRRPQATGLCRADAGHVHADPRAGRGFFPGG